MIRQSKQKGPIINNEVEKCGRFCCQEVMFMKFELSRLTFYKRKNLDGSGMEALYHCCLMTNHMYEERT